MESDFPYWSSKYILKDLPLWITLFVIKLVFVLVTFNVRSFSIAGYFPSLLNVAVILYVPSVKSTLLKSAYPNKSVFAV